MSKFFWFRIHNRPLILSLTCTVHSNNARLENRPPFLISKRMKQRKCVQESKTDGTKTSFRLQVCPYPNPFIEIKQLLPLLFCFVCLISFCLFLLHCLFVLGFLASRNVIMKMPFNLSLLPSYNSRGFSLSRGLSSN